ncbi:MAG TPA: hypothetical protein QF604_02760 [Candidatus Latescibacteria bacterium]|jgi:hypothetical protein|nr:hypothetical protein [Candidatus Latescibacterota bacterium]MDP7631414.1 hypothetical protein [Candidatus Latescibacterota bacterium]HJN26817.1 hypothetical protein [Candidatus Latescibacterota bacterium]
MTTTDWTRHLLPLPQKTTLGASRTVSPAALRIRQRGRDEILRVGTQLLRDAVGVECDEQPQLTIELGTYEKLAGHQPVQDLSSLPNSDQAYQIVTVSPELIVICGQTSVGCLYGAMTMAQLIEGGRKNRRLSIPDVAITDWPDIEQRGLWNYPVSGWIPWMSSMKLNFGKMAEMTLAPVQRGRRNTATIDSTVMKRVRHLGFSYVPYIVHLNFLHEVGLFRAHPELAGTGDRALAGRYFAHKQGNQHRAPCASQPKLAVVLGQWMESIAQQGADEISCWLSERPCQCECERCTPIGQFVLETRAFVSAWEKVRRSHPDLCIRIFSSTTTPEQDDRILAELPPEVRFERACASGMERVRHQPRDLFANPLLDKAAREGRWIASYDVPIGAYGDVDTPEVKVPQYSAQRIQNYVNQLHARGYAGAYGMLAWGNQAKEICGFAISALAEYGWNGNGRSVEDFATAWAVREGIKKPEAVGRWAARLGDVEYDVYDSGFPIDYTWGNLAQSVEDGEPPRFSEGIFRHFHRTRDFSARLSKCQQARDQLQPKLHEPLILATDVISSYVRLAAAIWHVAHDHAHGDVDTVAVQKRLARQVDELVKAGAANVESIRTWRAQLGDEPWGHRVHDAIGATETTVPRIVDHIRQQHSDLT